MQKITISLPEELFEFIDHRAEMLNTSRSQVIAMALSAARLKQEEQLAVEGYLFYAEEANEFTDVSGEAVAEAWGTTWTLTEDEGDGQAR